MKRFRLTLTTQIFIGLALGVLAGFVIHHFFDDKPETKAQVIAWIRVISRIFLNLIKVIIAPLIFSTLVVGIAGAGNLKEIGRIGLKAIIYFEIVTTLALFIGLGAVNLTRPGAGVNLPAEQTTEAKEIETLHVASAALSVLGECPATSAGVVSAFGRRVVGQNTLDHETGRVLRRLYEDRHEVEHALVNAPPEEARGAVADARRFVEATAAWISRRENGSQAPAESRA